MRSRYCPVCGSAPGPSRTVVAKTAIGGAPLALTKCSLCGLTYQPVIPTEAELASWYEYMGHVDQVATEPSQLLGHRLTRLLDRVAPFRLTGRLLDVGCGRGSVAIAARGLGWDVHVTEVSTSCVAELRPLFGDRLHHGELADAPFPPGSFDVVVMIEVLEHLPSPRDYVAAAARLLRPGGCLLVTTPNFRGISGRIRGDRWRVVANEHLTYFDRRSLRRLLSESGFDRTRIVSTGLDISALVNWARTLGGPSQPQAQGPARSGPLPLRVRVMDAAIQVVNQGLRVPGLGDSLRAMGERRSGE